MILSLHAKAESGLNNLHLNRTETFAGIAARPCITGGRTGSNNGHILGSRPHGTDANLNGVSCWQQQLRCLFWSMYKKFFGCFLWCEHTVGHILATVLLLYYDLGGVLATIFSHMGRYCSSLLRFLQ